VLQSHLLPIETQGWNEKLFEEMGKEMEQDMKPDEIYDNPADLLASFDSSLLSR